MVETASNIQDPEIVALLSSGRSERETVSLLAMSHWQTDWHEASRTCIVFAPWMLPRPPRGVGSHADEAYSQYESAVARVLERARSGDLRMWLSSFQKHRHRELMDVELQAASVANPTTQIGFYTTPAFRARVDQAHKASSTLSLNKWCDRVLRNRGVRLLQDWYVLPSTSILPSSAGEMSEGEEKIKWSIDVSRDTKASVAVIGRRLGVASVADVAARILTQAVEMGADDLAELGQLQEERAVPNLEPSEPDLDELRLLINLVAKLRRAKSPGKKRLLTTLQQVNPDRLNGVVSWVEARGKAEFSRARRQLDFAERISGPKEFSGRAG